MPQANVRPPSAPSAPTATPQNVVSPDIGAWQAQLADLGGQAANLRATLSRLNRQLNNMRIDNPARAGVQQQAANVASNLAVVEGKIAELQARIAVGMNVSPDRISEQGTLLPPPSSGFPFRRNPDPDMVVGMSFVLAMCIVLPISIAWAKRIWRGKPQAPAPRMDDISPRLERLEQAVDSIAIEIERVSEGQRFVTKILAERPMQASQAQEGAAEEKPILALGAGPAEPVRVNQGVKQGINQR